MAKAKPLTQKQKKILGDLEAVVQQIEKLEAQRNELILDAVEADVARKVIAGSAGLSEPMIYKVRRDQLEERQKREESRADDM